MRRTVVAAISFILAFLGCASAAQAATAIAGVTDVKGKPTIVIQGTNRIESVMVTASSSAPDGNWESPEVPVWSISIIETRLKLATDSKPGACWQVDSGSVYCRRGKGGPTSVLASLGGGIDSLLVDKSLQVKADGGPGNDSLYGGRKNDVLIGGPGRDMLQGEGGNDVLVGGAGNDSLYGDFYRDAVFSRPYGKPAGRDRILGGPGSDTIQGGAGADILIGGPGADWFENNQDRARDRIIGGGGHDTVRDPDVIRRGRRIAVRDRLSGLEALYLGFTRYRLR